MRRLLLPLLVFCLTACKKTDTTAPVITLLSPADNELFTAGTLVHVQAKIRDNNAIHMVHVMVHNAATGAEVLHFEEHIDASSYDVNETFTVASGITYAIEVEAIDHAENEAKVEISVSGG
jgi:hypothetical protein